MSIKINEQFSARRYTHGWELHQTKAATGSNAKNETVTVTTYHPNFIMLSSRVVDLSIGGCDELDEIKNVIIATELDILAAIAMLKEVP